MSPTAAERRTDRSPAWSLLDLLDARPARWPRPSGWLATPAGIHRVMVAADELGLDAAQLRARLMGRPWRTIGDFQVIPDDLVYGTVELAMDQAGSDAPLVRAALARSSADHHVLDFAMQTSEDVASGLGRACRYAAYLATSVHLSLHFTPMGPVLTCFAKSPPSRGRNATVAALLCTLAAYVREGLDPDPIRGVCLRWRPQADAAGIAAMLQAPVQWGHGLDALILDPQVMTHRPSRSHAPFAQFFDAHLDQVLDEVAAQHGLSARLQRVLSDLLPDGPEGLLGRAARRLGMSPRTLQRRLADDDSTFSMEVDALRRSLALAEMRQSQHSVSEVAFALGFSSATTFIRAFKRWHGCTPGALRRRALAGAAPPLRSLTASSGSQRG